MPVDFPCDGVKGVSLGLFRMFGADRFVQTCQRTNFVVTDRDWALTLHQISARKQQEMNQLDHGSISISISIKMHESVSLSSHQGFSEIGRTLRPKISRTFAECPMLLAMSIVRPTRHDMVRRERRDVVPALSDGGNELEYC